MFQLPLLLLCLLAIHPSILAQVCVVDLSLSTEEIQELMLTQLLPAVYKQQLIQHLHLQNDKQLLQDKLVSEVVRHPAIFHNHIKEITVWLLYFLCK